MAATGALPIHPTLGAAGVAGARAYTDGRWTAAAATCCWLGLRRVLSWWILVVGDAGGPVYGAAVGAARGAFRRLVGCRRFGGDGPGGNGLRLGILVAVPPGR